MNRPARRINLANIAILALASVNFGSCKPQNAPMLELRRVGSVAVPDSFIVSNVIAGPNGVLALISPEQTHLLFGGQHGFTETGRDWALAQAISVAFDSTGQIFQAVDAKQRALVRLGDVQPIECHPGSTIVGGILRPDGWVIAFADSIRLRLVILGRNGQCKTFAELLDGNALSHGIRLAADDSGNVLGVVRSTPDRVFRYDSNTGALETTSIARPIRLDVIKGDGLLSPRWVAAGLVSIAGDFVLTVADLRSDKRLLVLLDREARVKNVTLVRAPLAFVASTPDAGNLVAVRRIDHQSVEIYQVLEVASQSSN